MVRTVWHTRTWRLSLLTSDARPHTQCPAPAGDSRGGLATRATNLNISCGISTAGLVWASDSRVGGGVGGGLAAASLSRLMVT